MAAPRAGYDWKAFDSKNNEVDGHVECVFNTPSGQWSEPKFIKSPFITMHGLAPGLHYGQQVYEGLSACRNPEGEIQIFRPQASAARINHSSSFVSMPEIPEQLFMQCVETAVFMNSQYSCPHDVDGSLYIRPALFGSSCQIGLDPPDEFTFVVYVQHHIAFHGRGALKATIAEDFDRAATRGTGSAKVGGNYAPVIKWTRAAQKEGFHLLLHVDSKTQTEIEEFSTSGFIGIRSDGHATTMVLSSSNVIINSITVDSASKVADSLGWIVEKRAVKLTELETFSEVIAAGTAAGLVPIQSVYSKSMDRTFDFASAGPRYAELWDKFRGIQKGTVEDKFGWCWKLSSGNDSSPDGLQAV